MQTLHEGHGNGSPFWLKTEPKAAFCLPTHLLLAIPSNSHLDRLVSRGVAVSIFRWKAQLRQPHNRLRCDWRRATLHLLSPLVSCKLPGLEVQWDTPF